MTWVEIFFALFVTIGPVRPSLAFFASTVTVEPDVRRSIAIKAVAVATLVAFIITLFTSGILENWRVEAEAVKIAGGIILFLSALQLVLGEEGSTQGPPPALTIDQAVFPLAVPTIVTPAGIVALIAIEGILDTVNSLLIFLAMIAGVMVLNLVLLTFSHKIYSRVSPSVLKLIVRVFGVLLAGLAVQIAIHGLEGLGVIPDTQLEVQR